VFLRESACALRRLHTGAERHLGNLAAVVSMLERRGLFVGALSVRLIAGV